MKTFSQENKFLQIKENYEKKKKYFFYPVV